MMTSQSAWHVAVLIPAHNEEQLLPRCLKSVLQCACETDAMVDIVVAIDNSTDESFKVAVEVLKGHGLVAQTSAGNVGRARREAAEFALCRYTGPMTRCWLANTDADSVVPMDWLSTQLALAARGVEAVAGIVDVDSFRDHHPIVRDRFRSSYKLCADGTHPHVHGANLGIRADAYRRAGGWNELKTAEDWDLWNRLIVAGALTQSSTSVKIITSGRMVGRAPNGFADALAAHNPSCLA